MENLKLSDKNESVRELQCLLVEWGYRLPTTAFFGEQTQKAGCDFQRSNGLISDGVVDHQTWEALKKIEQLKLKEDDFLRAANMLNVEVEVIKSVQSVETGGRGGFFAPGKPSILFERHIFYRQLKNLNISAEYLTPENSDILSTKPGGYLGGIREYERLERAKKIDLSAALCSASWGLFQIMGFNFKPCGCPSVVDFVEKMSWNEGMQLELFVKFILENGYDSLLRKHDWAGFAKRYNGANYAINSYDTKLKERFDHFTANKKT